MAYCPLARALSTFLQADIADFSAGQKKKAMLAASPREEANLHVWDEPLNYIGAISCMRLEDLLAEYAPGIILAEHDQMLPEHVATRVLELEA